MTNEDLMVINSSQSEDIINIITKLIKNYYKIITQLMINCKFLQNLTGFCNRWYKSYNTPHSNHSFEFYFNHQSLVNAKFVLMLEFM